LNLPQVSTRAGAVAKFGLFFPADLVQPIAISHFDHDQFSNLLANLTFSPLPVGAGLSVFRPGGFREPKNLWLQFHFGALAISHQRPICRSDCDPLFFAPLPPLSVYRK
jgi:hypothetical protein